MSNNIRSNTPSNFLQVPSIDGDAPPSRRRFAGIIPIRRHSTGSRHSGSIPEPRRPTRKSTITPPVGILTVNSVTIILNTLKCIMSVLSNKHYYVVCSMYYYIFVGCMLVLLSIVEFEVLIDDRFLNLISSIIINIIHVNAHNLSYLY